MTWVWWLAIPVPLVAGWVAIVIAQMMANFKLMLLLKIVGGQISPTTDYKSQNVDHEQPTKLQVWFTQRLTRIM